MDMEDEDEVVVVAFFLSIAKLARVVQGSRYCCFFNLVLTLPSAFAGRDLDFFSASRS